MEELTKYQELLLDFSVEAASKLALSILIYIVGTWIINKIKSYMRAFFEKRDFDPTLKPFLLSLVGITLKIAVFISIAGVLGVEMTSFIAILGTIGVGIGLALSGTLQNVAGGIVLLILKPFKVGDFIQTQGHSGTVTAIQLFNTLLKTTDNKVIFLPNGSVANGGLINFSAMPTRRVDMVFGISYSDDIDKALNILKGLADADDRILKDPVYTINVANLGDSSVDLNFRVWVNAADYWPVFADMNKTVKQTFDMQGISIPFPQRDVHVYNK